MENKFKHTFTPQQIVVRQDDDESQFLLDNAGSYIPLVRIRETMIPLTDVVAFNLEVGQSFLPRLTVSFDDDEFHFRETDFVEGIDLITIFVGAAKDTVNLPIKNDYLIQAVESSPGSSIVTIDAILDVPQLYSGSNRAISGSSISVLEQVAKDCKLGFTTNISQTDDSMTWIQYQNNIDFIHEVAAHSYIDDLASIRVFVDQFANLTVVNLNTALGGNSTHELEVDPTTGELLEETIPLLLTMNKLDDENPAKISSYTPTNDYGRKSTRLVTRQNYQTIDFNDYETVVSVDGTDRNQQRSASSRFTSITSENTHQRWSTAVALNLNNRQVVQGIELRLNLDWAVQSLFMMQVVPVDIFNIAKRELKESQDDGQNLDELTDTESTQQSNAHVRNDNLSGNCLIVEMTWRYFKSSGPEGNRLRQNIKAFKI